MEKHLFSWRGTFRTEYMDSKPFIILILMLMSFLGFFSFCRSDNKHDAVTHAVEHGPFTIQQKRVLERRYDMNRGGMVKSAYSKYTLLYRGEAIAFPKALEAHTGYSSVWKMFILPGAPQPTVIAGSQNLYLITEENGAPRFQALDKQHSDFASLQWLDAENGQPGAKQEIYVSEDTGSELFLHGGNYLLVNQHVVIQVPDLGIFSFRRSIDLTGGYYADRVVGFSPDKNKVVFVGSKQSPERYDQFIYALLVYNFRTNEAYAVPFDQTGTRLHRTEDISPNWLDTYFAWRQLADSSFVLEGRVLAQLPYWQGTFTQDASYELSPVGAGMQQVLLDFVTGKLALSEGAIAPETLGDYHRFNIHYGEHEFSVGYLEKLKVVSFSSSFMSRDEEASKKIVQMVGEAFNEDLRQGKYQDLFTEF